MIWIHLEICQTSIFMHLFAFMHLCTSIAIHVYETKRLHFIAVNGIHCFYIYYLSKNLRYLKMEFLGQCGILLPSCGNICVLQQNQTTTTTPASLPHIQALNWQPKRGKFLSPPQNRCRPKATKTNQCLSNSLGQGAGKNNI